MLYSVDRFEGEYAVLVDENEDKLDVLRSLLPAGVRVGDMLRLMDGVYVLDNDAARARREQILRLQNKLRRS
jgi:hypothetical protein